MGVNVSIVNNTNLTWYYSTQRDANRYECILPGCSSCYQEEKAVIRYLYIRYKDHAHNSFKYEFNTYKGQTTFTLSETNGGSQIELYCSTERISQYCPNYGKS